jgi:acyl-CoA thioesterase-1
MGFSVRTCVVLVFLVCSAAMAASQQITILAFGDSLVAGTGLPGKQGFVPQLQTWLARNGGGNIRLVDGGVAGNTTADGLARIDRALTPDIDAVVVALGGNDVLRGIDPGAIKSNLNGIMKEVGTRGLPAMLVGIPSPPGYSKAYQKAVKKLYSKLARKHGAIYYKSMFAGIGQGRNMLQIMLLLQRDGLHPNARGVKAIVGHMGPYVLALAGLTRG